MNEDKIIQKLIEQDDKFEQVKDEMGRMHSENLANQDKMLTILERLDQERLFTVEWIRRIEKEVEDHSKEIKHIKQQLKLT